MDFFFRARDGDMLRWKAVAGRRGVSFSQHVRDALDAWPVEAAPVDDAGVASTGAAVVQTPPAALVEKAEALAAARGREVRPDPRVK